MLRMLWPMDAEPCSSGYSASPDADEAATAPEVKASAAAGGRAPAQNSAVRSCMLPRSSACNPYTGAATRPCAGAALPGSRHSPPLTPPLRSKRGRSNRSLAWNACIRSRVCSVSAASPAPMPGSDCHDRVLENPASAGPARLGLELLPAAPCCAPEPPVDTLCSMGANRPSAPLLRLPAAPATVSRSASCGPSPPHACP